MSLTRCLSILDHPVRCFMEARFPNVRTLQKNIRPQIANALTLHPPNAIPWGTIGTAIDYRIRYYFEVTPCEELVAHTGAHLYSILLSRPNKRPVSLPSEERRQHIRAMVHASQQAQNTQHALFPRAMDSSERAERTTRIKNEREEAATQFFEQLENELRRIQPIKRRLANDDEEVMARYCIILALYEEFARSGYGFLSPLYTKPNTLEGLLSVAEGHWVQDMCSLSHRFYDAFADLFDKPNIVLNPTFAGSRDVGGADADLIVDGCLIDIKTTISPKLDKLWVYQLLGYTLLDYSDLERIRSVGILYTRQGILIQWSLEELFSIIYGGSQKCDLSALRQEFRNVLEEWRKQRELKSQEMREARQLAGGVEG